MVGDKERSRSGTCLLRVQSEASRNELLQVPRAVQNGQDGKRLRVALVNDEVRVQCKEVNRKRGEVWAKMSETGRSGKVVERSEEAVFDAGGDGWRRLLGKKR